MSTNQLANKSVVIIEGKHEGEQGIVVGGFTTNFGRRFVRVQIDADTIITKRFSDIKSI